MKTLILGLVGSGKTTLYRQLNELRIMRAVEIELPQSCMNDEDLKANLFHLYMTNPNIDVIIVHPYFLPKNWLDYSFDLFVLDIAEKERLKRIRKRSKALNVESLIFPTEFLTSEKQYMENILKDSKYSILGEEKICQIIKQGSTPLKKRKFLSTQISYSTQTALKNQ